ncbi:MAG: hypothetical protein HKN20_01515, partial [Gemmatimonadetes bacterium]|nr:hypothetical protein [Gemmatimonadota bacterium]
MSTMRLIILTAVLLFSASPARAGITMDLVLDDLTLPIYATAPPGDARLFLAGQRGTVHIIENDTLRADPFLDIDSLVHFTGIFNDEGFYGLAFHPGYATNGYFFVYYMDNAQNTRVVRYQVSGDPNKADHASAEVVLTLAQPHTAHNGGEILFGPDGMFYVPLGDGGFFGDPDDRAQDPQQFFGKILRIDVDSLPYSIPPDNPFVGNAGVLDEIWAIGTRNPYRPSFDAATGDFWIADVGEAAWEEINVEWAGDPGGHNYGWSLVEGYGCFDPPDSCGIDTLDAPLFAYDHTNGDCSITGGFVYRGAAIPHLYGHYLYGDFCSRRVWAMRAEPDTVLDVIDLTPQIDPGSVLQTVTSIVHDGFGEPYVIDRTGSVNTGRLYRLGADFTGLPGGDGRGPNDTRVLMGSPTPNP